MKLQIAGVEPCSTVDGLGLRYVIFTQGCPHHCKGCHNPSTHSYDGGTSMSTDDIAKDILGYEYIRNLTLSGGEPFEQVDALCELLDKVSNRICNVWSFTGYTFEYLLQDTKKRKLLEKLDVLVDGKFEIDKKDCNLFFCGSSNQRVIDVKASLLANDVFLLKNH